MADGEPSARRRPFTLLAVLFLAVICVLHVARLFLGVSVVVGGREVAVWFSAPAALFTGTLAFLVWRESRR